MTITVTTAVTPAMTAGARAYARAAITEENASGRLLEVPGVAEFLFNAAEILESGKRGAANDLARTLLSLPAGEPVKTGKRGEQTYAPNGRRIETVAKWITRNAPTVKRERDALKAVLSAVKAAALKGHDAAAIMTAVEEGIAAAAAAAAVAGE